MGKVSTVGPFSMTASFEPQMVFAIIWVLSLSTSEENCDFRPFPLLSLITKNKKKYLFFPQVFSKLCCKTDVHMSSIDCSTASAKHLS